MADRPFLPGASEHDTDETRKHLTPTHTQFALSATNYINKLNNAKDSNVVGTVRIARVKTMLYAFKADERKRFSVVNV